MKEVHVVMMMCWGEDGKPKHIPLKAYAKLTTAKNWVKEANAKSADEQGYFVLSMELVEDET
jgi:hypothetical protein